MTITLQLQGQSSPAKPLSKTNSIEKNVATFDAKFPGLTQHSEVAAAPVSGRGLGLGLGLGATPSSNVPAVQQDTTLMGPWAELWEGHLHESE